MAKTTDRQVVNGETYELMDSTARESIISMGNDITELENNTIFGKEDTYSIDTGSSFGQQIPYHMKENIQYSINVLTSNYSELNILLLKANTWSAEDIVDSFRWETGSQEIVYTPKTDEIVNIGIRTLSTSLTGLVASVKVTERSVAEVAGSAFNSVGNLEGFVGGKYIYNLEPGSLNWNTQTNKVKEDNNPSYLLQRARTPVDDPIELKTGDVISLVDKEVYVYYLYTPAGDDGAWRTDDYTVETGGNYWVVLRRRDQAAASVSELQASLIIEINGGGYVTQNLISLNERVSDLEDGTQGSALPSYYYVNDYFPNKLAAIREMLDYANGVCFAFITDVHFPANEGKSKAMLLQVLNKTSVPFVIYGGDSPALYGNSEALEKSIDTLMSYMNAVGEDNWFAVHGNHDLYMRTNATPSVWSKKDSKQTYNIMMRKAERFVTNMNPDHLCYCIDIPAQKTRIVMLNSSDMVDQTGGALYTTAQLRWLEEVINELENSRIIVVSHIPADPDIAGLEAPYTSSVQQILGAFKAGSSVTIDGETYSFTGTTNDMICHINGHMHEDTYGFDSDILTVVSTCDAAYTDDGEGMVRGTITEQAVDVYFINYDNHTVKTIRLGRGSNRGWDYESGSVIS